jgi:hypothetical protein
VFERKEQLLTDRDCLCGRWSEFLATEPEARVRFLALPEFLSSSGSGMGPLSLMSTTEELLEKKSSGSCQENREYGRRDLSG